LRTVKEMPDGGFDLLDIALFVPPAILLTLFGFACAVEGWRRLPAVTGLHAPVRHPKILCYLSAVLN
jgi:hypothetical protein